MHDTEITTVAEVKEQKVVGAQVGGVEPEMVRTIVQARPDDFARLNGIRQTIEEMGVEGLFSAEGEQWHRHHNLYRFSRSSQVVNELPDE